MGQYRGTYVSEFRQQIIERVKSGRKPKDLQGKAGEGRLHNLNGVTPGEPISIIVNTPIIPQRNDWSAAIKLRDAAHAEILRFCGEQEDTYFTRSAPPVS